MTDGRRGDWIDELLFETRLPNKITQKTICVALEGFTFQLTEGKDLDWLAMAVRRALACVELDIFDGPDRKSNTDVRKELEALSGAASSTWLRIFDTSAAADSRLWDFAWHRWTGDGGKDVGNGEVIGEPAEYRRFKAAVAELDWLASFLRQAAKETEIQRGPWRDAERKRLRIKRGHYLAPVFVAAFGERATANKWPGDAKHKTPTRFMDFYQRMVALAFGEKATPNIAEVLTEATRLHGQRSVEFPDDVIPGLGGAKPAAREG